MSLSARKRYTLTLGSQDWVLGENTLIMGILNVTPDSFSDGGRFYEHSSALRQAQELIGAGADILDIGGESTRPFSDPVSIEEELRRVVPVIEKIREFSEVIISIDTTKAEVAKAAVQAGADIINDVSALRFDPQMGRLAADLGVPVILMHMLGTPKTMQESPHYYSLFSEIVAFLEHRIRYAMDQGVQRSQIIVDPGIGFGKTITHNLQIIRGLELFTCLDRPLLLGASRKRFIGTILDRPAEEREVGTVVVNSWAIAGGVHVVRVHDVRFHRDAVKMADALRKGTWHEP